MIFDIFNWFFSSSTNKEEKKLQLGQRHDAFIAEIQRGVKLKPVPPITPHELLMRRIRTGTFLVHIVTTPDVHTVRKAIVIPLNIHHGKHWTRPHHKKTGKYYMSHPMFCISSIKGDNHLSKI